VPQRDCANTNEGKRNMKQITLLLLLAAAGVFGQSLEEREAWASQEGYMKEAIEDVKTHCGAEVQFAFDKPSWNKVRKEWGEGSPFGSCSEVTRVLVNLCRGSEVAKEAVQKNLKSFNCSYAGKKTGFKFNIANMALVYAVETERPNVADEIMSLLKKAL
jgi:hypothetical protein